MKKVDYVTTIEALAIHAILLKKYGGTSGAVDMGLLESALFRPQTGYYKDLLSQATALFESIIINHPFTDGNKRAAFGVTDVFLRINGYKFNVSGEIIYKEIMNRLSRNEFKFQTLLAWMQKSVSKV